MCSSSLCAGAGRLTSRRSAPRPRPPGYSRRTLPIPPAIQLPLNSSRRQRVIPPTSLLRCCQARLSHRPPLRNRPLEWSHRPRGHRRRPWRAHRFLVRACTQPRSLREGAKANCEAPGHSPIQYNCFWEGRRSDRGKCPPFGHLISWAIRLGFFFLAHLGVRSRPVSLAPRRLVG